MKYQHVEGGIYELIGIAQPAGATLRMGGQNMAVYRGGDDKLWYRNVPDFNSRFALMSDTEIELRAALADANIKINALKQQIGTDHRPRVLRLEHTLQHVLNVVNLDSRDRRAIEAALAGKLEPDTQPSRDISGYCSEGDRCVCGGDVPAVRYGCGNWRSV